MSESEILEGVFRALKSGSSEELLKACREVKEIAGKLTESEVREVADALTSLFYLDATEHPEFGLVIDCAIDSLVALGSPAVGPLIADLADSDLDVNVLIARTLSKMGRPAAIELIKKFRHDPQPYHRAISLFALGLMDDPLLIEVFPEIVAALDDDDAEMRDTAATAIGNMIDCFGSTCLGEESADRLFEKLMDKLSDPHGGTRAKTVRAIGLMAKAGLLNDRQKERATQAVEALLGIDGYYSWDPAFIVRREAERAYQHLAGCLPDAGRVCHVCGRRLTEHEGQCPESSELER